MKKYIILVAGFVLWAAFMFSANGTAQEPPLDLGEQDLLTLSCQYTTQVLEEEGNRVVFCRRLRPEEIDGNVASVFMRVRTDLGAFNVRMSFRKSLWWPTGGEVIE